MPCDAPVTTVTLDASSLTGIPIVAGSGAVTGALFRAVAHSRVLASWIVRMR